MARLLIFLGIALLLAGLVWPWISRLGLFHLPGDIVVDRPGFRLYLPLATSLVISIAISLVLWLLHK